MSLQLRHQPVRSHNKRRCVRVNQDANNAMDSRPGRTNRRRHSSALTTGTSTALPLCIPLTITNHRTKQQSNPPPRLTSLLASNERTQPIDLPTTIDLLDTSNSHSDLNSDSFNPSTAETMMDDISMRSLSPATDPYISHDINNPNHAAAIIPPSITESPPRRLRPSRYQQRMDVLAPIVFLQLMIYFNSEVETSIIANELYGIVPYSQLSHLCRSPTLMKTKEDETKEEGEESMIDEDVKNFENVSRVAMDEDEDEDEDEMKITRADDDTVMQTDDLLIESQTPALSPSSKLTIRREILVSGRVRTLELSKSKSTRRRSTRTTKSRVRPLRAEGHIYHILVEMNEAYEDRIEAETGKTLPDSLIFDSKCPTELDPDLGGELLAMIVQYERAKSFFWPRFPPVTNSRLLTPSKRRVFSRYPPCSLTYDDDDGREIYIPDFWYDQRIRESIRQAQLSLESSDKHVALPSDHPHPFRPKQPFQPTLLTIREDCASYRLVGGWTGRSIYWDVGDPMYMDLVWKTHKATKIVMCVSDTNNDQFE